MNKTIYGAVPLLALLLAACSTNVKQTRATTKATDTTPPVINSLGASPAVVKGLGGNVQVVANVSDNIGIDRVEFYRVSFTGSSPTSGLIYTDTVAPYKLSFSFISPTQNGTYSYIAKVFDAAGNLTTSSVVSYLVDLPCITTCVAPSLTLSSTPTLLTAAGNVTLTANTNANKVEFYRNYSNGSSVLLFVDTIAPFALPFSFSGSGQNGMYNYSARAIDTSTGANTTAQTGFTIMIDTTEPTVSLVMSSTTVTAAGSFNISATASDNIGIDKVEFYQDGELLSADSTAPYGITANFTAANNGYVAYTAKAYDLVGNTHTSESVDVLIDIPVK